MFVSPGVRVCVHVLRKNKIKRHEEKEIVSFPVICPSMNCRPGQCWVSEAGKRCSPAMRNSLYYLRYQQTPKYTHVRTAQRIRKHMWYHAPNRCHGIKSVGLSDYHRCLRWHWSTQMHVYTHKQINVLYERVQLRANI